MLELILEPLSKEEEEELKAKYFVNGKVNWEKLNEEIKKELKENSERTRRWQEIAIQFSVKSD